MNSLNNKNDLLKKMEKTAYCKLYASKRYGSYADYFRYLSFLYNIAIVVLSIILINYQNKILNVLIIVASVVLFAISLFISSLGFGEKERELMRSYNEIIVLLNRLKDWDEKDDREFKEITELYTSVAHFSEPHKDIDMVKLRFEYPEYFNSNEERRRVRYQYYSNLSCVFIIKSLTSLGTYAIFAIFKCVFQYIFLLASSISNKKTRRIEEIENAKKELFIKKDKDDYLDEDWHSVVLIECETNIKINSCKRVGKMASILEKARKRLDAIPTKNSGRGL